jgi:hypothetical protein
VHGRKVRGTGGWRQQEWMLWQGTVVHMAGKRPEKQREEEEVDLDALMRRSSSSVCAEERQGRQLVLWGLVAIDNLAISRSQLILSRM